MLRSVSASSSCGAVVAALHDRGEVGDAASCRRRSGARAPSRGTRRRRGRSGRRAGRPSRARAAARDRDARARTARRRTSRTRCRRASSGRRRAPAGATPCRRRRRPCRRTAAVRAELPRARAHGGRRRRPEVGAAHLGLQRRAVERPGAGAALVVDDDPVVVQLGAEDLRDARQRPARRAGPGRR